jgi:hypothetical protein
MKKIYKKPTTNKIVAYTTYTWYKKGGEKTRPPYHRESCCREGYRAQEIHSANLLIQSVPSRSDQKQPKKQALLLLLRRLVVVVQRCV